MSTAAFSDTHAYVVMAHKVSGENEAGEVRLVRMSLVIPFLIGWSMGFTDHNITTHVSRSPLTWQYALNKEWWNGGDKSVDGYAEQRNSGESQVTYSI